MLEINYNPDVLSCLANLSNDEVFTPPELANEILDQLPSSLWSDSGATFLDPVTKSGVFLREIAKRLVEGLKGEFPDEQERVNHIFKNQLYGIAITELTALLARRSVYCSKNANSPFSVCTDFDGPDGNIRFSRVEHTWDGNRCRYCGASQSVMERGNDLETHAYGFIHTDNPESLFDMKFDVIIGNPPYQLSDGGHNASASPIYHKFVEQAKKLNPSYLIMIIPARWYSGGKGLDGFRAEMLADKSIKKLVDYPKLYDAFPGVKIRGGVCYFLRDKNYQGPCVVQTMWDNLPLGDPMERHLNQYDVLVRRNEAISILEKVKAFRENGELEGTYDTVVSSSKPFGFRTNFHGRAHRRGLADPVKLYGSQKVSWIDRGQVQQNAGWIDQWKVLMSAVQGTSAAIETKFLSAPKIIAPGEICSETYNVAGRFDDRDSASRCASYLKTRFVRFLVSLRKISVHASKDVYSFVPVVPFDRMWNDEALYNRYGLTEAEIAYIEETVAPIELEFDLESGDA
ncbi:MULTISPECIES: Eco57I restriction-modification methylase domain-containing protein [unclassified Sphingobium]|uniref:Eco57I restriction-modification methylase domain-containing protein n=1 Tax=unclassified Sphingobium TaxID=2611147 RepID=UPI0005CC51E3|nr:MULTISPECIES: Eco57I restriction-modification methylase domain-containing protein [unclassified Sphingobium]AJR24370.1 restriction endonuclease [Sphingobium sp. YBL2]AMK16772.1 adenine-specific DNA-methyltransferase [Sphingobium sp. MI1205]